MMDDGLLYRDECYAIQGAIFEVYRQMGSGFLEAVYQECLQREFESRGIVFQAQAELALSYKGKPLSQSYRADFVCYGKIVVELKAVSEVTNEHRAQLLNYLKATGMRLGLLVNFCHYPISTVERLIC